MTEQLTAIRAELCSASISVTPDSPKKEEEALVCVVNFIKEKYDDVNKVAEDNDSTQQSLASATNLRHFVIKTTAAVYDL